MATILSDKNGKLQNLHIDSYASKTHNIIFLNVQKRQNNN